MPFDDDEKNKIKEEVHRAVVSRNKKMTNFIEWRAYKVIFKRYAGVYFTLCVDQHDNELSYMEIVHLFVEMLDRYFGNVCELDLVYNFHKVYTILDEFFLAGEVQETSKAVIGARLKAMDELDKKGN